MWDQATFAYLYSDEKTKEEILKYWRDYFYITECSYVYGCFEAYFGFTETSVDREFIFSFPALPVWYNRVIKKLNRYFKNINYEILEEKPIYINKNYSTWLTHEKTSDTILTASCPIFKLNLSAEYSKNSKWFLRYFLHHVLRIMSYSEGYLKLDEVEHDKKYDSIQWICDLNNRYPGYRSICEGIINKDMFKYLDDTDLVNKTIFKGVGSYSKVRQTAILASILETAEYPFEYKFKVGDIVVPNNDSNIYSITNENTFLAEVIKVFPFGNIEVKVLKHLHKLNIGYTATVKDIAFNLYTEEK